MVTLLFGEPQMQSKSNSKVQVAGATDQAGGGDCWLTLLQMTRLAV